MKIFAENKKAYHNYEIIETYEAGLVLRGAEIKAIRAGKINIAGSHAKILQSVNSPKSSRNNNKTENWKLKTGNSPELFLINANIQTPDKENATRTRKLLMHRTEINKLIGKTQQKGLTLVPLKIYLKNGRAKIALGLGRGKKIYDKREDIKKKDLKRQRERGME
ncbi:MAG: SsrA-binding protein [Patescibacteria group bacterium]|nr:SsrA-binding protein [Patescibacteria group bacterium]